MPVISFYSEGTYHNTGPVEEGGRDTGCEASDASGDSAEHNKNIMSELPEDLSKVVQAWSELPEHVRETIVTLVNKAAQEVAADWSSV